MAKKAETAKMIDRDKYDYQPVRYTDAAGKTRHSAGNGDALARALLGLDLEAVIKVAKANGLDDLVKKHQSNKTVNAGQFRMILGNALRALVRKGEEVAVNGTVIKKLDQKEPVIKPTEAKTPRKAA